MSDFTESIKKYRSIVEGTKRPNVRKPIRENVEPTAAQSFKLPAYAFKMVPRYFNLSKFCSDHVAIISESKNFEKAACRLISRRIAEGFDLHEYMKADAADYYPMLARNLRRSVLAENRWIGKSILTEGLPNHDTSWLMRATETMRTECEAGQLCKDVINDLAREYAQTEDGHHEAFEMARDALEKRAWELGLFDEKPEQVDTEDLQIDMLPMNDRIEEI